MPGRAISIVAMLDIIIDYYKDFSFPSFNIPTHLANQLLATHWRRNTHLRTAPQQGHGRAAENISPTQIVLHQSSQWWTFLRYKEQIVSFII